MYFFEGLDLLRTCDGPPLFALVRVVDSFVVQIWRETCIISSKLFEFWSACPVLAAWNLHNLKSIQAKEDFTSFFKENF